MPLLFTDRAGYWDHYAKGVTDDTPEEAIKNAFGWTQYKGHGPGEDLLGDPLSMLELGSGRGNAVAALATKGIEATGIDISPTQVEDAQGRWANLPGAHAPAVPGSYGIQGMYGNGFKGRQVWIYRWAYEPATWADLLRQHGFVDVHAQLEPAPEADHVGTLVVSGRTVPSR